MTKSEQLYLEKQELLSLLKKTKNRIDEINEETDWWIRDKSIRIELLITSPIDQCISINCPDQVLTTHEARYMAKHILKLVEEVKDKEEEE
jgi:hypothetical protein